jgi:hypothetical protein
MIERPIFEMHYEQGPVPGFWNIAVIALASHPAGGWRTGVGRSKIAKPPPLADKTTLRLTNTPLFAIKAKTR